jgi:hypothetical protein
MEFHKPAIIHHMFEQIIKIGTILMTKKLLNLILKIYQNNVLVEFNKIPLVMINKKRKTLI